MEDTIRCPECFSEEVHVGGPYSDCPERGLTATCTCEQCDFCWEE